MEPIGYDKISTDYKPIIKKNFNQMLSGKSPMEGASETPSALDIIKSHEKLVGMRGSNRQIGESSLGGLGGPIIKVQS